MFQRRPAHERGHGRHGWLDTRYTFSFADYYDPAHMGFRSLRVMNEDRVQPGRGFGMHGHEDMEIVTYVLAGALEHKDSMGNGEVLRPGELQRITAGRGIWHGEGGGAEKGPVNGLQLWINLAQAQKKIAPGYQAVQAEEIPTKQVGDATVRVLFPKLQPAPRQ